MSTKGTLKHSWDDAGKAGFHLYQECFDFENEFVYLELTGVPFEAASSINLSGSGPSRVSIRLPQEWARKLGLIE